MSRIAKVLAVVVSLFGAVVVGSVSATATAPGPIVPYGAAGYHYQQVPTGGGPAAFSDVAFDDGAFDVGSAPFGQLAAEFDCDLTPATTWASNTDLLVRRTVTLPAGATDVVVRVAIDNDLELYWNGTLVDTVAHAGCAEYGSGEVTIPGSLVTAGDNVLAVRASDHGGETFLDLEVTANFAPDCASVTADQTTLWPPNHGFRVVTVEGGTDPEDEPVALTVSSVTQDEPLDSTADGNTEPDADRADLPANQVRLRAERSGDGDGRVYRIGVVATDSAGASCSTVIPVGVPHDQRAGASIIDTTAIVVDSFGPPTSPPPDRETAPVVTDDPGETVEVQPRDTGSKPTGVPVMTINSETPTTTRTSPPAPPEPLAPTPTPDTIAPAPADQGAPAREHREQRPSPRNTPTKAAGKPR
ncbi:MAG: hypothetical protein ABIQ73_00035 [Acidimicrobiales bacterium]